MIIYLILNNNQFSGIISDELCDISSLDLSENQFCLPYPSCISQDDIDSQDTSECDD